VDVQLKEGSGSVVAQSHPAPWPAPERSIIIYWLGSLIVGVPLLFDMLTSWNVPATFAHPWLVVYLLATFALSQVLYVVVARHDGRPLHWGSTLIFALGNGFCETLAFAIVFRVGALLGSALVGLFAPAFATTAGFITGLAAFILYGGLIHGLFWLRLLPPHLDDAPLSRRVRRLRPIAEVALVIGWSICFWYTADIWTIVFLHVLVDLGLMLRVRPEIFPSPALQATET
jgi:chlorophyllide a hydrolase